MPAPQLARLRGSTGAVTTAQEFAEFAEASAPRLRRTAFLMCGDWYLAEDLVQTALAKVFVSWRKIRQQDAVHAYATRTLVNVYLADKRIKRVTEVLTSRLPERTAEPAVLEDRIMLLDALAALPRQSRVVVVLRYWADLSVDQVADVLGCSAGNVKSQSSRALDKLRNVLDGSIAADERSGQMVHQRRDDEGGRHG